MKTKKEEKLDRLNTSDPINSDLMKLNLRIYLDSKITAGGLYGLTIDDDYLKDLIKVIKISFDGKKYKRPKDVNSKYFRLY